MHELVTTKLSSSKSYSIQILFADDPDDMEVKAEIECLKATMQVKIANSDSEFVCLKKDLPYWEEKIKS